MLISIRRLLSGVYADTRGTILVVTGLSFLFLVAVGGAGYDLGRQRLITLKLQQAADAASLAGALLPIGVSANERRDEALRFYNLNYPETYLGVDRPTPEILVSTTVKVSATTDMDTLFVDNIGIEDLDVDASSTTLVRGRKIDYDLVMVVDESGSTRGGGNPNLMTQEQNAIREMLNIIFPEGPANPNVRFGLIGYTQYISNKWGLSAQRSHAETAINSLAPRNANFDHYGLEAGLKMITGDVDHNEENRTVPTPVENMIYGCASRSWVALASWTALAPAQRQNCWRTTGACNLPNAAPCFIQPIDVVKKNTNVPPARTNRSDDALVSSVKNVIFITDGYIMVEPAGCSAGPAMGETPIPGAPCPNYPAFQKQCDDIKSSGANLFVISFHSQGPGDVGALRACASVDPATGQPRYFFAPTGRSLRTILQNIGVTITKVRIFE